MAAYRKIIDAKYGNLPDRKYIHKFVGVMGEDLLPGGTAILRWPAYSGEGLGVMLFTARCSPEITGGNAAVSYSELVDMGRWQLITDEPDHRTNMLSGLMKRPASSCSRCLEPEEKDQGIPRRQ